MALRELFVKIQADTTNTEEQLKRVSKEVDKAKQEFNKLETAMSAISAIGLGAMISSIAKSSLETFGKFEKYETVLKTTFTNTAEALKAGMDVATYSTTKATEAMNLIKQFAAETPYSVDELTGSFIKLANRGMVPSMDTMKAFGDIAASQGKSFDQFTEAVLDAVSGEFERMKEFGIKASKSGSQVTLAFKNVTKTIASTPEAIQAAIIEMGKMEGVAGGMQAISQTLTGRLSALGDSFDNIKNTIGSILATVVTPILDFFTDSERGATRLNIAVGLLSFAIGTVLVMASKSAMLAGYAMLVPYLPIIKTVAAISAGLMALYLVLEDIYVFLEYGHENSETFFGDFLRWIGFTNEDMQKMSQVFYEFKNILSEAGKKFMEFVNSETGQKIIEIGKTIFKVAMGIALLPAILVGAVVSLPILIIAKWEWLKEKLYTGWMWLVSVLKKSAIVLGKILLVTIFPLSALYLFRNEILSIFNFLVNYIKSLPFVQKFIEQFLSLKEQLANVFSNMWQSLKATFQSLLPINTINTIIDGLNWISQKLNEFSSGSIAQRLGITPLNLPIIPHIQARALGGPIEANMPYLVGERGPEIIIPNNNGTVIPNEKLQSVGGNNHIVINLNVTTNANTPKEFALDLYEAIEDVFKNNANVFRIRMNMEPV